MSEFHDGFLSNGPKFYSGRQSSRFKNEFARTDVPRFGQVSRTGRSSGTSFSTVESLGKFLLIGGLALAVLGGLILVLPKGLQPFRLPGDIVVEKPGFSFYLPLTTMILFSSVLWLVTWAASRMKG